MTPDEIRERLEEAGATLLALPGGDMPNQGVRVSWPDFPRDVQQSYGYGARKLRPPRPSSAAIDQMDESFRWLALVPNITHRKLLGLRAMVDPISGRHLYSWEACGEKLGCHRVSAAAWHERALAGLSRALSGQKLPVGGMSCFG